MSGQHNEKKLAEFEGHEGVAGYAYTGKWHYIHSPKAFMVFPTSSGGFTQSLILEGSLDGKNKHYEIVAALTVGDINMVDGASKGYWPYVRVRYAEPLANPGTVDNIWICDARHPG
jgi:hypothetical protein